MSKNLIARISVAAVAIPAILWICYQGGNWLFGMVTAFALLGISEFLIGEGYKPFSPVFLAGALVVASLMLRMLELPGWVFPISLVVTVTFLISGMLFSIGKRSPAELFTSHSRLMWGILYIGLLYPYVLSVHATLSEQSVYSVSGGDALLFLFGLLWIGDTAAMFIGGAIGKHRLAPAVSPNKTIEGFLGGIVGALAIGVIMYFWKLQSIPFHHVMILSLGCSVFGQLGDLVESMWKRSLGIKDSSALIPGHGGILDRFDSLLFAAPFMSFYLAYLVGK